MFEWRVRRSESVLSSLFRECVISDRNTIDPQMRLEYLLKALSCLDRPIPDTTWALLLHIIWEMIRFIVLHSLLIVDCCSFSFFILSLDCYIHSQLNLHSFLIDKLNFFVWNFGRFVGHTFWFGLLIERLLLTSNNSKRMQKMLIVYLTLLRRGYLYRTKLLLFYLSLTTINLARILDFCSKTSFKYLYVCFQKKFNSIQFNSIQFDSIRFNSIQFDSIQFDSIQFNWI
jgi:hypothetical protein